MRHAQTLDLGDGRTLTVHELRAGDVRRLLAIATPAELARPLPELFDAHGPALLALLRDCATPPTGEAIEDLSLSECLAALDAWLELHRDFFARVAALLASPHQLAAALPMTAAAGPSRSTAPASSPSRADTPRSSTTAGPSSSP